MHSPLQSLLPGSRRRRTGRAHERTYERISLSTLSRFRMETTTECDVCLVSGAVTRSDQSKRTMVPERALVFSPGGLSRDSSSYGPRDFFGISDFPKLSLCSQRIPQCVITNDDLEYKARTTRFLAGSLGPDFYPIVKVARSSHRPSIVQPTEVRKSHASRQSAGADWVICIAEASHIKL